jgi:hypothetical protein
LWDMFCAARFTSRPLCCPAPCDLFTFLSWERRNNGSPTHRFSFESLCIKHGLLWDGPPCTLCFRSVSPTCSETGFLLCFVVLGIEPRTWRILGKCSVTELHSQPRLVSCLLFPSPLPSHPPCLPSSLSSPGWLQTGDLPVSAFQVLGLQMYTTTSGLQTGFLNV